MADVTENQDLAGNATGVSGHQRRHGEDEQPQRFAQDSCKNASLYLQLATR